ncbi:uncharacterized protein [Euphorbia lathyris]|uniref:uncharacterized protein n=1 Tax=Euphorbia lathyris TaxID=212925 RepID=UPI003313EA52
MTAIDSVTDYSQTERLVLLIDLNPILHLQNPNGYLKSLLSTARTILSFPPLSSSLFSFKPFFSSLSPLLSSSKLSIPSFSLSFNHPDSTLESLTKVLNSVVSSIDTTSISSPFSRASLLAASMRQLVHDYAWDSLISDTAAGTLSNCNSFVKSNLVILLSPVIRSRNCLSDFFSVELDDECLINVDCFVQKFHDLFESVNDAFVSRDIHFSWVDVKYETESGTCRANSVETELECGFFESGIRDLGWGFCSSESIILGSALIPFELIFPRIGISPRFGNLDKSCESIGAQLSLEIADVSGKPLECKCCDLELVNLDVLCGISSFEQKKRIWRDFSHGIVNVHVKAVRRYDKFVKFEGKFADPILVRESSVHSEKGQKETCSEYFEDRVLEILSMEKGEMVLRKSVPIWQILSSFLCREDYWALVSLSNSNGDSLAGVLKPFTVSSALLSIVEDPSQTSSIINEFGGTCLDQSVPKTDTEKSKPEFGLGHFGLVGSQSGPSPVANCTDVGDCSRKRNRKNLNMLLELTWSAFCKAAFENFQVNLEDVYFARACNKSKKLKFLKCWMKQIKKSGNLSLFAPEGSKQNQKIPKETDDRLTKLPQESEQPIASCSSVGDDSLTGASRIQDEVALDFRSETLESYFNNLPQKIQQGLESEEVHLESLAHRLVNSSIYWLYRKFEMVSTSDSQNHVMKSDGHSSSTICVELTKLLLRDPKDLAAMCINGKASNPSATDVASEDIVRQYELQILFRLEMLQSEVGASFGESTKQKFVKHICLLLENIQCQLQGGFFGDWSLDKYVAKVIKSRYCQCLGDVVQKIYSKMDLLLFEDEDESPNSLLNSEDSHQSRTQKQKREKKDKKSVSAENDPFRGENDHETLQGRNQADALKIIEAQQRRERARRFASFTSWAPNLQRIWASKQQKAVKVKTDSSRKVSKRKERNKTSDDIVCETPMTGIKRSFRRSGSRDKDDQVTGTVFSTSVSKALFQDDD